VSNNVCDVRKDGDVVLLISAALEFLLFSIGTLLLLLMMMMRQDFELDQACSSSDILSFSEETCMDSLFADLSYLAKPVSCA
jgi:hypothetical protein